MTEISKDEISGFKEGGDLIVYKKDSTIYSFEDSNYHISNDSLYGKGYVKFSEYSYFKVEIENAIPLTNIEKIQQDELNPTNTTWIIIGGMLLTVAVGFIMAMAEAMSGI
jgi:hypothetical protein